MNRICKTVIVFFLSIALLFTMTPTAAIAEDAPAAQDQKQEQKKEEPKKTEPEKKETTQETEKPASSDSSSENNDSGNESQEAKEDTTSPTEAKTDADKGEDSADKDKEETKKEETKKEEATQKEETKPSATKETKKDEEKDKYPAQTLTASAGGVKVTLKAPEGSFPEGSKLKAKQVGQKYIDAVDNKLEAQGSDLRDAVAIDVTPVDKSGKEIQPKKSVSVTFSGTGLDYESGDTVAVYHVSDGAGSVTKVSSGGSANSQTFSASHFSVYVASTTDPDASGEGTEASRYTIHFGESVTVQTSHRTNLSANYWSISAGSQYLTEGDKTTQTFTVTNNNPDTVSRNATIRWQRNSTNEYFYLTLLPKPVEHTVTYMLQDAGASSFTQDGDPETVTDNTAATPPSHDAEKEGADGKIYVFDGWYTSEACTERADLSSIKADMTVYARYVIKKHEITFMFKDAGASSFAQDGDVKTVDDGDSVTPPSHDPEKVRQGAHYTFDGKWYTDEDCTQEADLSEIKDSDTFYGQYVPVKHTVNYKFKDVGATDFADDDPANEQVDSGKAATQTPTHDAEKEGCKFSGWCTDEGCTKPADLSKITEDMTVYSRYAQVVTLTFDKHSDHQQATVPDPIKEAAGATVTLGDSTNTYYEGHHFLGWNTEADGSGTPYAPGADFVMPEEDITLYAQWTQETVTVEYYWNYSPTPTGEDIFLTDENIPDNNQHYAVTKSKPTRSGYLFLGWSDDPDAIAEDVRPGDYYEIKDASDYDDKTVKLYAIWGEFEHQTEIHITELTGFSAEVIYNGSTQKTPMLTVTGDDGKTAEIGVHETDTPPTHGDYKYGGYVRVGNKTGDDTYHIYVNAQSIYAEGKDVGTHIGPLASELYSHHQAGGGSFEGLGEYIPVTGCELKINKAEFTVETDSASKMADGNPLTAGGRVKVKEVGADGQYTGQTIVKEFGTLPTKVILHGDDYIIIKATGSQTDPGTTTNTYELEWGTSASNYTVTEDLGTLTVYGHNVRFNKNTQDEVTNMPDGFQSTSATIELPDNEPEREHYTFLGWTTDAAGTGDKYQPKDGYIIPQGQDDVTFYAQWEKTKYTVKYQPNGGTWEGGSTDPKEDTYESGKEITIIDPPTNVGHTFMGWKDTHGNTLWPGEKYIVEESTTFTAQWDDEIEFVTYDPNGGVYEGSKGETTYQFSYGETIHIAEAATSEDGLLFKGWLEVDGELKQPGAEYKVLKTTKFIAQWEMPITFDPNGGKFDDGSTKPIIRKYEPGSAFPIEAAPSRVGYTFKEWNTKKDGSGDSFKPGDQYESSQPMTFYAIWVADPTKKAKIVYNPNGGVFRGKTTPTTLEYDYDEIITIAEEPTREGYTFLYWEGSEYYPGDSYKVVDPVHIFVAKWEKNENPEPDPDPDKPEKKKEKKKNKKKDKKKDKKPETGDTFQLGYAVVMILSLLAMGGIFWRRRREE